MKRAVLIILVLGAPGAAFGAAADRVLAGDPANGAKLYAKECAACHGDDGKGGRTGVSLRDSGRMNQIRDDQMFAMIKSGQGLKKPDEHGFGDKLQFLDVWDAVAHVRSLHQNLSDYFPKASRYVVKPYTIDSHGQERIEKLLKKKPEITGGIVFTFYSFPNEEGRLAFVPQEPVRLDELKKPNKIGYLVFLPFKTEGYEGEAGVGMDQTGKILKIAVPANAPGAELMNKSLSRFEGMGRKGTKEPFKIGGGKTVGKVADDVFALYQYAMETVTMFDREENDRTWADEE